MPAGKGEPVSHPFALGDDVLNGYPQIGKAFQERRVVIAQSRDARPDSAGISVVNDGVAIEGKVSLEVPQY